MQYLVFDIILYPGHRPLVSHDFVDFQRKLDHFDYIGVKVNLFLNQLVIIITINLDDKTVLRFGLVIDPNFSKRNKVSNGEGKRKERMLLALHLFRCYNLFSNL